MWEKNKNTFVEFILKMNLKLISGGNGIEMVKHIGLINKWVNNIPMEKV